MARMMLPVLVLLAGLAPAAAQPGAGQDGAMNEPAAPEARPQPPPGGEVLPGAEGHGRQPASLIWTHDLEGREIRNPQGDELGTIEGVLLDNAEGRVPYVMVQFGGFLGFGSRLVAVPWGALMPTQNGRGYTLNVTEDILRAAPSVKENNFAEVADANWQQSVEAYWSQRAGLQPAEK